MTKVMLSVRVHRGQIVAKHVVQLAGEAIPDGAEGRENGAKIRGEERVRGAGRKPVRNRRRTRQKRKRWGSPPATL
jgi:hypothetical protein